MKLNEYCLKRIVCLALACTLPVACEQGGSSAEPSPAANLDQSGKQDANQPQQNHQQQDDRGPQSNPSSAGETQDQTFRADLDTFQTSNVIAIQNFSGDARFQMTQDNFIVDLNAQGLQANNQFLPAIHEGNACPTMADDSNNDGFVDAIEAQNASGKFVVLFDQNFGQQAGTGGDAGAGGAGGTGGDAGGAGGTGGAVGGGAGAVMAEDPSAGAMTNAQGAIQYSKTVPLQQLLTQLRNPTGEGAGASTPLGANEQLDLTNKVMILHGVPQDTQLPNTVQSVGNLPAWQTLPVACGELRSDNTPDVDRQP